MKRIKFVKDTNGYRQGDTVNIDDLMAVDYVQKGYAILSKDMTPKDYKTLSRTKARRK